MFDNLPESSKHSQDNARTTRFFLVTGLIYGGLLVAGAIASIFYLNPNLVDALDVTTMVAPPPPPAAPPPAPAQQQVVRETPTVTTFTPPTKPPEKIPDAATVQSKPVVAAVSHGVPGGVPGGQPGGVVGGVAGGGGDAPPPPPPPPEPKPTPEPTPKPEPPKKINVSGGVLQGSALKKVQPPYPPIAKAARASGAVQVQVTISEEGRVIAADVVSGHPLLRDAAVQAARQWVFKPTELSGVPVKVQGVLTFNFTLQ
jgi:periplasmic protein TonB